MAPNGEIKANVIIEHVQMLYVKLTLLIYSDRKYYSKRLLIIKEINNISEDQSISLKDAVKQLDEMKSSSNWSLDKLSKAIHTKKTASSAPTISDGATSFTNTTSNNE